MPNKKSSIKRARQNERRRIRNRSARADMRTHVKKVKRDVEESNLEGIEKSVSLAQSKLAKAAKRNLIKSKNASRKTSRLMRLVNRARSTGDSAAS